MDYFDNAWKELSRRKGRTIISIVGYTLAVTVIVLLVTVLQFAKAAENNILSSVGTHFIVFSANDVNENNTTVTDPNAPCCPVPRHPIDESEGFYVGSIRTKVFPSFLYDAVLGITTVKEASPYLLFRFKDQNDNHLFFVGGLNADGNIAVSNTACSPQNVTEGRFLQNEDDKAVMLDETYAKVRNLSIDNLILIAGSEYNIVGIISSPVYPAKADVYMTFSAATEAINKRLTEPLEDNEFNLLLVESNNAATQNEAMDSIKKIISGYSTISTYNCYRPAAKVMGMNENSVWLLVILIVIFSLAISLKTQFSSILERKQDVGIFKIIGWTNKNIVLQIITESMIQALLGGITGCILAFFILAVLPVKQLTGLDVPIKISISWAIVASSILMTIVAGAIAGGLPALIVAKQSPSDVLRKI